MVRTLMLVIGSRHARYTKQQ